jgi:hypothetical protein
MNPKLNAVLAIATILGGIAAIWFFWDKIRSFVFGQAKSETKNLLDGSPSSKSDSFAKVEKLIPDLLAEIRADLADHRLFREFVLLEKGSVYNHRENYLVYYFEDHPELENQVRILENHGFVKNTKYNNVARYVMSEELAEYLLGS